MTTRTRTAAPHYDERLAVPWYSWPAGALLALLVAAELHGGAGGARAVVPYVVVPLVVLALLVRASTGRVRIADGLLHVPSARVPLTLLGEPQVLDREATRRVRGPYADPQAHVATRVWLPTVVRVPLQDPADDTPYWLVGSRRPAALAEALRTAPRG